MKKQPITFLVTGLIAGLICVGFRFLGSPEKAIMGLTWAVGPLFFFATVGGIAITDGRRYLQLSFMRYLTGFVICTLTYITSLVTFFAVFGFSSDWFNFRASANVVQFGIDVWLGLLAAGVVGAVGITVFAVLLTRRWGPPIILRLIIGGLLTISVTFLTNSPFRKDWFFVGTLFPIGNAIFCYVVGTYIWQHIEGERQGTATAGPTSDRFNSTQKPIVTE